MTKALQVGAIATAGWYLTLGMIASADSWAITDKIVALIFVVSVIGIAHKGFKK